MESACKLGIHSCRYGYQENPRVDSYSFSHVHCLVTRQNVLVAEREWNAGLEWAQWGTGQRRVSSRDQARPHSKR